MIVERRRHIRKPYKPWLLVQPKASNYLGSRPEENPVPMDLDSDEYDAPYGFSAILTDNWEDELGLNTANEVTPDFIVHLFAILTGLSAFSVGSYLFDC